MELFIEQERRHCLFHVKFNRILKTKYPTLIDAEKKLKDDLDGFLKNKSLKFNLAFAEGFESSFGVLNSRIWLDDLSEFRDGADPEVLALWDWHMAEEFEHREVCYKVFMALEANNPIKWVINGYFYRIYGAYFAMKHLGKHTARCMFRMLSHDWKTMTPAEVEASKGRLAAFTGKLQQLINSRKWVLASPFYNPKTKAVPDGFERAVANVAETGLYGKKKPA